MRAGVAALAMGTLVVSGQAAPPLPARLSEAGLYLAGTGTIDPRNRPFAPQYPLWTDGAGKTRWVQLPPGTTIDARDPDRWVFPVGTRFWKEFAFGGRKVETRMIWQSSAAVWTYASYVWNDEQTDATLADPDGVRTLVEVAPGRRHAVPSREDCRTCHETGGTPVLGFTALQLSDDRDPLAPHAEPFEPGMVTLAALLGEGTLAPAHPQLAAAPRIPGDARTRAALGYLSANCGHCHHDQSTVATVRFPLAMPGYASVEQTDAAIAALAARITKWDLPHTPPGTTALIAPGDPDRSALVARMRSRRPSSQMPPLGTVVADREAIDLVSAWIADRAAGDRSGRTGATAR